MDKILTKEEILKGYVFDGKVSLGHCLDAMDKYAKQFDTLSYRDLAKRASAEIKNLEKQIEIYRDIVADQRNKKTASQFERPDNDSGQGWMRWVKASERLPNHMMPVVVRYKDTVGGQTGYYDFSRKVFMCTHSSPMGYKPEDVQWLDEFPTPPNESVK